MTKKIVIISTNDPRNCDHFHRCQKNCDHFHHFVVVIKSTDLNMMAPCFYHESAVKLTTQKTAGSMDMSVSGLVAKSVTGMVTFGSSGSGVQFTMEEVTLDLVVNDIGKQNDAYVSL